MRIPSLKNWLNCEGTNIPRLYFVGGTVRDMLLGRQIKDIDLVCKGAKEFASALARCNNAALVPMEKKPDEPCYRVVDRSNSENYLDIAEMRGETIDDDLRHRDFTINAIAAEVKEDGSPGTTIDPLNGAGDIEGRTIKTVSASSLVSDPLRILRAVRLAASLDFTIEGSTLTEMKNGASLLRGVSAERIMAELLLILKNSDSASHFRQMDHLGILDVVFPEIISMKGCLQNGFHHKDVWGHSMLVMEHAEHIINDLAGNFGEYHGRAEDHLGSNNRMLLLKLSALLHDVGKPATRDVNPHTGRTTFYRHDREGAILISSVAERLKMSGMDRDFMALLIAEHLYVLNLVSDSARTAAKMRWCRRMGDDSVPAIILGMADVLSSRGPESTEEHRQRFIDLSRKFVVDYYRYIKEKVELPNLISGNDIIALGVRPGPEIGDILEQVRCAQDAGEVSSRGEALELAKKLAARLPF